MRKLRVPTHRLVLGILAAAFAVSFSAGRWTHDLVASAAWHSFGVVAAAIAWTGAFRSSPGQRRFPVLAALGLTLWVGGDIAVDVLSWSSELPDVSIVDAFHLGGSAGFLAAAVALAASVGGPLGRDALLDGSMVAASAGLVVWLTLVRPAAESGSTWSEAVALASPASAVLLLAALAWMWFHPQRSRLPSSSNLLAPAFALLIAVEVVSTWFTLEERSLDLETTIDRSYQLVYGLIALAPFVEGGPRRLGSEQAMHPLRLLLLAGAVMAAPVTLLAAEGEHTPAVVLWLVVSALAFVRLATATRGREHAQIELARRASEDALTGLANRSVFMDELARAADQAEAVGEPTAVLHIDIDHFTPINDTYGHATGDAVLAELGRRIRGRVRDEDVAARLGADEFAVLCSASLDDATWIACDLLELAAEPFVVDDVDVAMSISIGVAATDDGQTLVGDLLVAAEAALSQAKRSGRNTVVGHDRSPLVDAEPMAAPMTAPSG